MDSENPYQSPIAQGTNRVVPAIRLPFKQVILGLGWTQLVFSLVHIPLVSLLLEQYTGKQFPLSDLIGIELQTSPFVTAVLLLGVAPLLCVLNQQKRLSPKTAVIVGGGVILLLQTWIYTAGTGLISSFPSLPKTAPFNLRVAVIIEYCLPTLIGFGVYSWWVHLLRQRTAAR